MLFDTLPFDAPKNNVSVIDCFNQVPDSCFIERIFPSEHYTEYGRKLIAKSVADMLNKL